MLRPAVAWLIACLACAGMVCAGMACAEEPAGGKPAPASAPGPVWLALGGETFTLEVAADPATRFRGLSGRPHIGRSAGMLFVYAESAPRAMVMRDCPVPIDVAFLDRGGRVVALSAMAPVAPRGARESRSAYEARLPVHASGAPAHFAIEVAGGRLAVLGVELGDVIALDAAALMALAR